MPLFEYKCNACDKLFETVVKRDEEEPKECIHCHHDRIEKQYGWSGGYKIKGMNTASTTPRKRKSP